MKLKDIVDFFVLGLGKIHWPSKTMISAADQDTIRGMIKKDYYVVLTRRKNHLSTYFTNFADWFLSGKWGYWAHALMNLEDEVKSDADFRLAKFDTRELIEATGSGVHVTPFEQVFDVHSVALLVPKNIEPARWTELVDLARAQIGKPYDSLFNILDDSSLSCVEFVRRVLQGLPDYQEKFAAFEALIKKNKNLSPQMIYDCGDFDVVFEARV